MDRTVQCAPENLPNTVYDDVIDYFLDKNDAGKAYKSGKSLLDSQGKPHLGYYIYLNKDIVA